MYSGCIGEAIEVLKLNQASGLGSGTSSIPIITLPASTIGVLLALEVSYQKRRV